MRGEGATWHENHLVPSYRHGRLDEVYWTYSYGPIDDESAPNGVGGVLVVCTETTRQMKIEAALRESERQLQRMNDELEERVSAAIAARIREQTRLAEAEETLRQAQKVETLGQLTGGVAHDFNNLLTPVMGALDFARFALDRDADAQEVIAVGLQAADRARTLVQRLLAFSRRQHLAPRDVGIDALIDNVVELAQRSLRPGLLLSTEVEPGLPDVRVDPDQLVLALLNLVVNARDAIPGHGSIAIRAGEDRDPPRTRMGEGRFLRIDVVDDGAGMDGDTLRRAAEPFFTTKEPGRGTGLGLSSVQGLAMQSGGDFQLRSASGSGTTASLWLPLSTSASTPAGATEADAASGPARAPAARILLVDDDPLVRASAAGTLRRAGYEVHEAVDAASALATLRDGRLPDLLLSDHAMPGMPGMDLLRQVRREWPALPCMLVTGYADDLGEDVPGVERLPKPCPGSWWRPWRAPSRDPRRRPSCGRSLPRVGHLHHLHLLAVRPRGVHFEHLHRRALPADRQPRLGALARDRVVPVRLHRAARGGIARALGDREAGAHAVVPGRPVLAADVVEAGQPESVEGLAAHAGAQFLGDHPPIQQHAPGRGAGVDGRFGAGRGPALDRDGVVAHCHRQPRMRPAGGGGALVGLHRSDLFRGGLPGVLRRQRRAGEGSGEQQASGSAAHGGSPSMVASARV